MVEAVDGICPVVDTCEAELLATEAESLVGGDMLGMLVRGCDGVDESTALDVGIVVAGLMVVVVVVGTVQSFRSVSTMDGSCSSLGEKQLDELLPS